MNIVFANRTDKKDFVVNEIERLGVPDRDIYIAVAFFTESSVIKRLIEKKCRVQMVVRLGFPTSPRALEEVMALPGVQLRVYTARSFHPKLYIFGDEVALVGSANLTHAAIWSNQEVVVRVDAEDDRFAELASVFDDYWDGAEVPTAAQLKLYKELYVKFEKYDDAADAIARDAAEKLGNTAPANINRGEKKRGTQSLFLSHFGKAYQEGVAAFEVVRKVYQASGYRKVDEADIPLRLEIDSFISFVREKEATGESWELAPLRTPVEQELLIQNLIERWKATEWSYFEDKIVGETYPRLKRVFASRESIMAADDGDLFDGLATLHSFHDRYRFFNGGLPSWRKAFPTYNDPKRTRETLVYLVFGEGDIVERMANVIFDPRYKLQEFGKANVQELVGWCNQEELPIINGRTTKVLRFFGSKVVQVK
ncbi:MAG: phospholipase D-like domain-containing protein [Polaromonas sp.]|nr:phospholipase D-like domain-containing protein [Polaromonas sp.]